MSRIKIKKLTPEQTALIPVYREKWRAIALSTKPIDRQKAREAILAAYNLIDFNEPEIIFCDSPNAIWNIATKRWDLYLRRMMPRSHLHRQVWLKLQNQLRRQLTRTVYNQLHRELCRELYNQVYTILNSRPSRKVYPSHLLPQFWVFDVCWFDFCISVLNCSYNSLKWEVYQSLCKYCNWFYIRENTCLICDRPTKLAFDNQNHFHAEGKPAIQFADGYSLYFYRGVAVPEKYGTVPPQRWQSRWLLEEDNSELLRFLVQEIGYDRVCQELEAAELDYWQ